MARVLIVEDSQLLCDSLQDIMQKYTNFMFDIAQNYEESQKLLKTKRYEFAVVDLHLPDSKDGEIVALVNKHNIAPIIFTADFDNEMRETFESANVVEYVLKDDISNVKYVVERLRQLELNKKRKVLIVDDSSTYREYLKINLQVHNFQVLSASNGEEALEILTNETGIELMISDYHMPKIDGLELVYETRKFLSKKELSIIILTADRDPFTISRFLKAGAEDYIQKPFSRDEFYSRLYNNLDMLDIFETIKVSFDDDIIELLSEITEFKSSETGFHVKRIQKYSYVLARLLGIEDSESEVIAKMALLHDIGKVTIPDKILAKPGKLTSQEYECMKEHSENGYILVKKAFSSDIKLGQVAMDITRYHHEKYDGSGYPKGLKGEEIPLAARIVGLVDVFDALANKRVYKDAWNLDEVVDYIKSESGTSFDPNLVELFLSNRQCFEDILRKYSDVELNVSNLCKITTA